MITKDKSPASGIQTVVVSASGACTAGSPEEVEQFITDQHSSEQPGMQSIWYLSSVRVTGFFHKNRRYLKMLSTMSEMRAIKISVAPGEWFRLIF